MRNGMVLSAWCLVLSVLVYYPLDLLKVASRACTAAVRSSSLMITEIDDTVQPMARSDTPPLSNALTKVLAIP